MKKIATITFHWAPNYGAVLQAFALQKYLLNNGYETEIINYIPARMKLVMAILSIRKNNISSFIKEKKIKKFRKKEMKLSKKYINSRQLKECSNLYDAIITGSDQIWNQSFTLRAEGKPTLSYFLNFANKKTRKIAYAVSFGSPKVNDEYKKVVSSEIEKFHSISVRETSGEKIVNDFGRSCEVVCDPTLLLDAEIYSKLADKANSKKTSRVFSYIINSSKELPKKISAYIANNEKINFEFKEGIYEWLNAIRSAEVVVTNSFHGVVFSVIFHRPFIATLIEGSGMNDRITTLLKSLSLDDRIITNYNETLIDDILKKEIDWDAADKNLNNLKNVGINFLNNSLGEQ